MKTQKAHYDLAQLANSPSQPVGPFVPFAYHQHYVRGARYYDPHCVPSVSYGLPTSVDLFSGKKVFCKTYEQAVIVLRANSSNSRLGRHGQRGILRVLPDDYPHYESIHDDGFFSGKTIEEWCAKSENSPYNRD